jgi:hypothetical protein
LSDIEFRTDTTVVLDKRKDYTVIKNFGLRFADHVIEIGLDIDGSVDKISVNGRDMSVPKRAFNARAGLVPQLVTRIEDTRQASVVSAVADRAIEQGLFVPQMIQSIRRIAHHKTSSSKILSILQNLSVGKSEQMLENIKNLPTSTWTWRANVAHWTTETRSFIELKNYVIANSINPLLDLVSSYLTRFALSNNYIAPIRATAERYYRRQDVAVDEVDFRGQNLPMFIRNLSDAERRGFAQWLDDHVGFSVRVAST